MNHEDLKTIEEVIKNIEELGFSIDSLPEEARDFLVEKNPEMTIPLGSELLEWAEQLRRFMKNVKTMQLGGGVAVQGANHE